MLELESRKRMLEEPFLELGISKSESAKTTTGSLKEGAHMCTTNEPDRDRSRGGGVLIWRDLGMNYCTVFRAGVVGNPAFIPRATVLYRNGLLRPCGDA